MNISVFIEQNEEETCIIYHESMAACDSEFFC